MFKSFLSVYCMSADYCRPKCWGHFKNTYELLNLRALKYSPVNKIHTFQCMGKIFCVKFQRYSLKFHTKYLTHTLKDIWILLSEASFGLPVLSLSACVRVSVNHELVCAITRHKFELESPNLDQKMQNISLKVPIVLGTDWAWPSRSNFTILKNYVYLHRFCNFEIFVWNICLTAPHRTWLRTHCLTTTCPPTGSRNKLWNCLAVYLGETIGVQPASIRRLTLNFTNSCQFSTYCTHLRCGNFICQHSAIVKTTVKQCPLAFILCDCRCWKSLVSHRIALFLAP